MKLSSALAAKLSALASALIFSVAGTGIIHAAESDMPDEIAPADSPAVRDTNGKGGDKSIKQRLHMKEGTSMRRGQDNSRYQTDGSERYEHQEDYSGAAPKREDRY